MHFSPITESIEHYWQRYLETLSEAKRTDLSGNRPYLVDQFGDTPELADELGQLVLAGIKTATCSALWEWPAKPQPLPTVGLKTIVLAGDKRPLCIIETTEVELRPFNQVDARFAYDEGEGDRTIDTWRREHWSYFSRVLPQIGKAPTPEMVLVCERFRVVFRGMPLSFVIRDAQMDDGEAVLELWQQSGATVSRTDQIDPVQTAIAADSTDFLIAEHNGQIIGTLIGGFDGWRGNLYRLVVRPDFRRYGVARALVAEIDQRFTQQGVKRITSLVEKDHADAVSFWQSVGYEPDWRIIRHVRNL